MEVCKSTIPVQLCTFYCLAFKYAQSADLAWLHPILLCLSLSLTFCIAAGNLVLVLTMYFAPLGVFSNTNDTNFDAC
jgi:hypothetical protein